MTTDPITYGELRDTLAELSGADPARLDFSIRELGIKPGRDRRYYRLDAWPMKNPQDATAYFVKVGRHVVRCEDFERRISSQNAEISAPRLLSLRSLNSTRQLGVWAFMDGETRAFEDLTDENLERILQAHVAVHALTPEFTAKPEIPCESPWGEKPALAQAAEVASGMGRRNLAKRAQDLIPFETRLLGFLDAGGVRRLTHHDIYTDNIHWRDDVPVFLDWESIAFARPAAGLWPFAELAPHRLARMMEIYAELLAPLGGTLQPAELGMMARAHHAFRALAFGYRLNDQTRFDSGLEQLEILREAFS